MSTNEEPSPAQPPSPSSLDGGLTGLDNGPSVEQSGHGCAFRLVRAVGIMLVVLLVAVFSAVILFLRFAPRDSFPHVASTPAGTYTATLDSAVPGRTVDRDCGQSTPTLSGRTVWVFCDTAIYDPGRAVAFITSATAGSAATQAGTAPNVADALSGAHLLPTRFMPAPKGDCPDKSSTNESSYWGYWTTGLVTLTDVNNKPTNTVVDYYDKICVVNLAADAPADIDRSAYPKYVFHGSGVGSFTYDGSAGTTPVAIKSSALHDLWSPGTCESRPANSFGAGAVVADGYVYVYKPEGRLCTNLWLARVALNVPAAQGADSSLEIFADVRNYQYWTGSGWGSDATALSLSAPEAQDGSGFAVEYVASMQRFVMMYRPPGMLGRFHTATVRTAFAPEGPWSDPVRVDLPQCDSSLCRAWEIHSELSDSSNLWFSYYQSSSGFDHGRVMFATMSISAILATPQPTAGSVPR